MPFLGLDYGDVVAVSVKAACPRRCAVDQGRVLISTTTTHQRGPYEEGPKLKPTQEVSSAGPLPGKPPHATSF